MSLRQKLLLDSKSPGTDIPFDDVLAQICFATVVKDVICHVMWNLFTVGNIQFSNYSTIVQKLHKPSVGRGLKVFCLKQLANT